MKIVLIAQRVGYGNPKTTHIASNAITKCVTISDIRKKCLSNS